MARYDTTDGTTSKSDDDIALDPSNLLRRDLLHSPTVEVLRSTPSLGESDAEFEGLLQGIPESQLNQPELSSNFLSPPSKSSAIVPLASRASPRPTSSKRPLTPFLGQPLKRAKFDSSRVPGGQENSPTKTIIRPNHSQKSFEQQSSRADKSPAPLFMASSHLDSYTPWQARTFQDGSTSTTIFQDKPHTSTDTSALNGGSEMAADERINKAKPPPLNTRYTAGIYTTHHKASMGCLSLDDNDSSAEKRDEDDLEFERWVLESVDVVE